MPPPRRESWATLSGPERLAALRTFGVRGLGAALRWREYARRVRLAERVIAPTRPSNRLRYAKHLYDSGQIGEG